MNVFVSVLRQRPFRHLWIAHLVSNLGDWLAFLALFGLTVLDWGVDALHTSILAASFVLPLVVVQPVAGVWVDRWNLRHVLVASDWARCLLLLLMMQVESFSGLCLLLFLHQSAGCFFNPAQAAALPRLVSTEQLVAANALCTQAAHASKLLGPALAGVLVAALGARGCFAVDAVSFAASALLLSTLPRLPAAPSYGGARSLRHEMVAGLQFIRRTRAVQFAVAHAAASLLVLGAFLALVAVYARDRLAAGPRGMGFLIASIGVGALCGAIAVVHTSRRFGKEQAMTLGMFVLALSLVWLGSSRVLALALVGCVLLGAGAAATIVPAQALVQETAPRAMLGRVQSAAVACVGLSQLFGMAVAGGLALHFGEARVLAGAGIALAVSAVILSRRS